MQRLLQPNKRRSIEYLYVGEAERVMAHLAA
jgi:hypothetical protein